MVRHNLLISYRNFLRFKSSFFINLIGLSTGLACVLLIFIWVNDELKMDQFHEYGDRLYQMMENVDQGGGIITRESTSGPTADALVAEFPEVEMAITATINWSGQFVLTAGDQDIKAKGIYASPAFFKMFSFGFIHGDRNQVLADKKSIVITESLAKRLYGSIDDVVGKMVELEHDKQFHVSGVMADLPTNSSFQFEYVLNFEGFREENEWVRNWFNTAPQTYILFRPGTDVEAFNKKIFDLVRTKTEGKASHRSPFVREYRKAYLYNRYENGALVGGRIEYVRMFSIIAGFILLIACINFMNLSTARASRRLKEVGVKKAIGARKSTLVAQYLSESILMAFISLVVALLLVVIMLPKFNLITEKHLTLAFDPLLISVLLGIVLFTGLVAGSYPALYLSKFNPAVVLKGKLTGLIGEAWARKGLVMFQFTLSIILIVSVWVVYKQINFIQTRSLGYDKDNVMIISSEGKVNESSETFLQEVQKIEGVVGASSTGHDMTGHNGGTYGIEWEGKDPNDRTEFERVSVNYDFIELMGIEMKEGRTFSKDFGDEGSKIIFNEAGIKFMGMTDPVGKKVKLWGNDVEIIGVAKDFNFESFHEVVKPLFFFFNIQNCKNIMVRVEQGKEQETIARLEAFYKSFNPGFPFSYRFLDEDYQQLYVSERRVATLSKYFAGLAILISCLGLFGLAAFTAERRVKEIGIRKILGSSNRAIVYLLSGEFTKMVLVAIAIALPASWYFASKWLEGFAFHIKLEWWFFAGSGLAALLIAWLTVGLQTIKASRINPTECLRSE
ncbi:MAG TPA: ABC transporter permease [Chryseolinea sp.]|nr:ABC transporter permease [Chryseolinea sp.]